ncbi:MAG: glycoside hydrolase family 13 protein [Candidatus Sericytochromatia bacterium]|nr:glycoside hydrolase family 13 protein [Candidatus Sericytochromatia bacterium]
MKKICISAFALTLTLSACKQDNSLVDNFNNNNLISDSSNDINHGRSTDKQIIAASIKRNSLRVTKSGSINGDGLYSDQTELYTTPVNPAPGQPVKVRLRAYKGNLTKATLITSDGQSLSMKLESQDKLGVFEFWSVDLSTSNNTRYKFRVENGGDSGWYNAVGFYTNEPDNEASFWYASNFQTPDWAKSAVYYQIFVDRFYNGNPKNDVKDGEYMFPYPEDPTNPNNVTVKAQKWDALPEQPAKNRDFFGGDIEGVRQKLTYLNSLGINTIYFNPIFQSPSNHKYDTQDYRTIDPHFASNSEFKKFVQEAHSKGIRVIIDGVYNHTGSWHRWFNRAKQFDTVGAFQSQQSPWADFYSFSSFPSKYTSWWGFDTLPKLNYASSKLRGEIYSNPDSIAKSWLKDYDVDGWRLDVPNEAGQNGGSDDHSIWQGYRTAVKSAKKDAVIIGELWKNAQPYLQGDQFDGVMNYEGFADAVSTYINDGYTIETIKRDKISPTQFELWIRSILAKNPMQANQTVMNLLDSHDTSRFMYRTEGDKWKMYEAAIFQMTFVGAPTIFYGDEIGTTGAKDPDCRRTFNWNYDKSQHLTALYKKMIQVRKDNSALRTGTFETLLLDDQNGIFSYGRMDKKNRALVILNNTSGTKTVTVNVAKLGFDKGAVLKEELNNTTLSPRNITVDDNRNITIPVYGHYGAVLTANNDSGRISIRK